MQIEYTVESGIYGNVVPQVFTSVLDVNESNSPEFKEYETNELEFIKNDEGKELEKIDVETLTKEAEVALDCTWINYFIGGGTKPGATNNPNGYKIIEDGIYTIQSKLNSNKYIHCSGAATANGTSLVIYEGAGTGAPQTQWQFERVADTPYYYIISMGSGRCLNLDGDGDHVTNSTSELQIWDQANAITYPNVASDYLWYLKDAGDGYFYICNKKNNRVIDVMNTVDANGQKVIVWDNLGNNGQKWKPIALKTYPNSKSYGPRPLFSQSRVYVNQAKPTKPNCTFLGWNTEPDGAGKMYQPGDEINTYGSDVNLYAQWSGSITYDANSGTKSASINNPNGYKIIDDGLYLIQSKMSGGRYLHSMNASIAPGDTLGIFSNGYDGSNSRWQFERYKDTPYYYIIDRLTGMAMNILDPGSEITSSTVEVKMQSQENADSDTNADFLWYLKDAGSGYYHIYNKKTGKVLDVVRAQNVDGALVATWDNNGGDCQKWNLIKMKSYGQTTYGKRVPFPDAPVIVNSVTPTKSGYSFVEWNTKKDGTGTKYKPGDKITYTGSNITLYAQYDIPYDNKVAHWTWGFENGEGNNKDKKAFHLKDVWTKKKYGETVTYTTKDAVEIPNGFQLRSTFEGDIEGSWVPNYPMGKSFTHPAKAVSMEYNYDPITYNITYNLGGGTLAKANPSTYNVLYGVSFPNSPTKTGYDFAGWYIGTTKVTGINVGANAIFSSADDMYAKLKTRTIGNQTVTAKWTPKQYSIWLYNQDGQDTQVDSAEYNSSISSIFHFNRCPWSEPTGYKFAGWFTAPTGGAKYTGNEKVTGNMNLYAQYSPIAYTITYNLNGGSISGQKTTYNIETASFTLPTPTRSGYTFSGWTGTGLSSATKTVMVTKGSTGNRSYTANWKANTYIYNIKYVSKSGVALGTATVSGTYGSSKNVTAPAKTGYSTPAAQNVAFDSVNAKTITFTYTPVDYAITYDLTGGSISGQKTSYNIETANFTLPTPTRSGYTFAGWTGTGLSSATKSVTVAKGSTGTRSYTATWAKDTYTISYNLNGGSVTGNPTSYQVDSADITLKNPTKTGHQFAGWTGTGISSASNSVKIATGSTGNRSYTANWKANTVYIAYGVNGGTVSSSTYSVNQYGYVQNASNNPWFHSIQYGNKDDMYNASTLGLTKNGYSFAYWQNEKTGTKYQQDDVYESTSFYGENTSQTTANTADVRCYVKAIWTPINYAITYDLAGGSISGQKTSYNIETASFTLPTPARKGYTFAGWTGTGLSSVTKSVTVAKGSTGARSYTATWTKDTYTISYNLNGGSVTGNPTSYQVDTADITLKNPSKTGYSFAGWTGSNGTTAQTTVKIAKGSTGNKSYTANWTANTYTYNIKYVSKSGVALGTATVSGTFGSSKNVTAPAKTGYSTPVAQKVVFDSVNAKTITFTYTPINYTITYDVNSGNSLSGQHTTYNVESSAYTLPTPSRTGHDFTGWTGSNGETAQTTVVLAKGTTGNKSYKANWKAKTYTYTVNYVSKSGINLGSSKISGEYGTSKTATAPAKTGYATPVAQTVKFDSTTAKTITFTYEPVSYSISYGLNGGSISNQKTSYNIETADFTLPTPTKAGHTFAGWTWSGNITPQKSVTIKKGTTGNKSYTANWTTNSYTLTYNANGGTVTPASNSIKYGDPYILPTPSKVGYKFNGWFTSATGGTQATTSTKMSGNATVYAQWTPNKLKVNYYPNGATKLDASISEDGSEIVEIDPNEIRCTDVFNYDGKLPDYGLYNANRFIREGYTSNNLYHAGNLDSKAMLNAGDNVYAKTQDLAKAAGVLSQLEKGDVTLNIYAHWEPKTYTNYIRHWAYGFENKEGNNGNKDAFLLRTTTFTKKYGEKVTYITDDATTIPNGFSLKENFGSSAYEGSWKYYKMGTSFSQPSKATTVEYDYVPITYTIAYNLNGGTLTKANPSSYNVLYGVDFTNEPVRSGYKFLGWYIDGKKVTGINVGCNATFTSADDLYAKLATRTTGNQTVEAKWEKLKDLTITNTVSGNMGSKDKEFSFATVFPSTFANTTLKAQKNDGSITTITVDANGKCTFTLKHGESFAFKELTEAQFNAIKDLSSYGISENDYSTEGYKTSFKLSTDAEGNLAIAYANQNGTVLPTGIILSGSGMAIIVALIIALGWVIRKKFLR